MSAAERPQPGVPRPYAFPTAERQRFANGLDVLVVPLRRLPIATALLMCDAGAECDAVTLSGVASLTAEALAEGTRSRDAVSLADTFEQLGGSLDTGVTWTHAECSTTVLAGRLPDALQLLAEVLREPAFPEGEVTRLREERLAELLQQRTEPRGLADDMFARFCFSAASRYARSEGGDEETVARLTRDAVVAHHAHFIVPSRSRLIVVGDVDVDGVMQLAESALGTWQATGARSPAVVGPCSATWRSRRASSGGKSADRRSTRRARRSWPAPVTETSAASKPSILVPVIVPMMSRASGRASSDSREAVAGGLVAWSFGIP